MTMHPQPLLRPNNYPRTLGELLAETRKRLGYSRQQVEELTGISANTLAKYETAGQMPSAEKLATLCMHLHLDPREALLFSLGDGQGEHLEIAMDRRWFDFCAFIDELRAIPPDMATVNERQQELNTELVGVKSKMGEIAKVIQSMQQAILDRLSPAELAEVAKSRKFSELSDATAKVMATAKENGSDRKDPSRLNAKSKPKGVAPTTSKRPSKGDRLDDPDNDDE